MSRLSRRNTAWLLASRHRFCYLCRPLLAGLNKIQAGDSTIQNDNGSDLKDDAMNQLMTSLVSLLTASWDVIISLLALVLPWTALVAWVAFWLLAVNWVKLRDVMIRGGWIGVVLIGFSMILVWGVVAPPVSGTHHLFGLSVSNFVGKTVYVTSLLTIMFLCGSVQLSGACGSLAQFLDASPEDESHGHDSHGHGHGGHAAVHDDSAHSH